MELIRGHADQPLHRGHSRDETLGTYWALEPPELLRRLDSTDHGLSSAAAAARLRRYGQNLLEEERLLSRARVPWNQVRSPLLLLLLFAAVISAASSEWGDALIVGAIVLATAGIGYKREYGAQAAAAALRGRVRTRANVLRDGRSTQVPLEEVVPGVAALLGLLTALAVVYLTPVEGVTRWLHRGLGQTAAS